MLLMHRFACREEFSDEESVFGRDAEEVKLRYGGAQSDGEEEDDDEEVQMILIRMILIIGFFRQSENVARK